MKDIKKYRERDRINNKQELVKWFNEELFRAVIERVNELSIAKVGILIIAM